MYSNGEGSNHEVPRPEQGDETNVERPSKPTLAGDKQELKHGKEWMQIKVEDRATPVTGERVEINDHDSGEAMQNGFFSTDDGHSETAQRPSSPAHGESAPPETPEKDSADEKSLATQSPEHRGNQYPAINNQHTPPSHEGPKSSLSIGTNGARKSSAISSMVFVITALETIAASKEARKRKGLGDSVHVALSAIRNDESPTPETVFEPLRLATETSSIPLTTTALDCIGKLITYSYFSMPANVTPSTTGVEHSEVPLIERAIDTICDCFQDEATPAEVQLQIVKSLLAAVLNDKIVVHGAGLLKAVRQIYNIFLLSKSGPNQQVAQGTLSQMVGQVFERVRTRLSLKETRINLAKLSSGKGTATDSQIDLNSTNGVHGLGENETVVEPEATSDSASVLTSEVSASREPGEKLTLQSFENAKNFDDTRIGDNAPTMVTRVAADNQTLRTPLEKQFTQGTANDEHFDPNMTDEDEEDEIYVKDAFLVFRSMCRLSTKQLPPDQLKDLKSQNMRSKLVSLAIIRTLLNNNMDVFTSPLVTIRSSVNNEPTSFGQAVNQYLRLAVSRNGASSVKQVFETSCEIFWLMLKDMRVMLKVGYNHCCCDQSMLIVFFVARDRSLPQRDIFKHP